MTASFLLEEDAVEFFKNEMLKELKENSHKSTWELDSTQSLFDHLVKEVFELHEEIILGKSNYREIISEAADIANLAMMIADKASKASGNRKYVAVYPEQVYYK